MTKDYSQVNFRIPTKLKERIEDSALLNERSITAELVFRLEQSFANEESSLVVGTPEFNEMVQKSFEMTERLFKAIEEGTIEINHKEPTNKKAP